jgi:outer membrane protein OmpA-like peptidoglycan-associated protein
LKPQTTFLYSGDIFLTYGPLRFWDISLDMPVYHDRMEWNYKENDHTAFGNLALSTKLAYPLNQEQHFINQAYFLKVIFPTGNQGSGFIPRHAFYIKDNPGNAKDKVTSDQLVINPMMIWTLYLDKLNPRLPIRVHANIGGAIHSVASAIAALGVEYLPIKNLSLFLEISGESRVKHYLTDFDFDYLNDDIFLLTPGARYTFDNGLYATLAFDFGIGDWDVRSEWSTRGFEYSTKGSPSFGIQFTMGWSGLKKEADADKDGIINVHDKCPQDKEDMDNFQDEDGCPDIDNDRDGVLDVRDQCPNIAASCDGCPVSDTDGDGILDNQDKCPDKAEDMDGFKDKDGCPDDDNDEDHIFDKSDKCPQRAEDFDGFQDEDGCPDLDNDGDGVLDANDKCPNAKGYNAKDGCPEQFARDKLVLLNVTFKSGSANLSANSFTILDMIVSSLNQWGDVKLEIQGHTDNVGSNATNMRISQARAESVRSYLISKGVSPERLKAVGYGESRPVADNNSAAGREKNRRVVLKRID